MTSSTTHSAAVVNGLLDQLNLQLEKCLEDQSSQQLRDWLKTLDAYYKGSKAEADHDPLSLLISWIVSLSRDGTNLKPILDHILRLREKFVVTIPSPGSKVSRPSLVDTSDQQPSGVEHFTFSPNVAVECALLFTVARALDAAIPPPGAEGCHPPEIPTTICDWCFLRLHFRTPEAVRVVAADCLGAASWYLLPYVCDFFRNRFSFTIKSNSDDAQRELVTFLPAMGRIRLELTKSAASASTSFTFLESLLSLMNKSDRGVLRKQLCQSVGDLMELVVTHSSQTSCEPDERFWGLYTQMYNVAYRWSKKDKYASFCYTLLRRMECVASPKVFFAHDHPRILPVLLSHLKDKKCRTTYLVEVCEYVGSMRTSLVLQDKKRFHSDMEALFNAIAKIPVSTVDLPLISTIFSNMLSKEVEWVFTQLLSAYASYDRVKRAAVLRGIADVLHLDPIRHRLLTLKEDEVELFALALADTAPDAVSGPLSVSAVSLFGYFSHDRYHDRVMKAIGEGLQHGSVDIACAAIIPVTEFFASSPQHWLYSCIRLHALALLNPRLAPNPGLLIEYLNGIAWMVREVTGVDPVEVSSSSPSSPRLKPRMDSHVRLPTAVLGTAAARPDRQSNVSSAMKSKSNPSQPPPRPSTPREAKEVKVVTEAAILCSLLHVDTGVRAAALRALAAFSSAPMRKAASLALEIGDAGVNARGPTVVRSVGIGEIFGPWLADAILPFFSDARAPHHEKHDCVFRFLRYNGADKYWLPVSIVWKSLVDAWNVIAASAMLSSGTTGLLTRPHGQSHDDTSVSSSGETETSRADRSAIRLSEGANALRSPSSFRRVSSTGSTASGSAPTLGLSDTQGGSDALRSAPGLSPALVELAKGDKAFAHAMSRRRLAFLCRASRVGPQQLSMAEMHTFVEEVVVLLFRLGTVSSGLSSFLVEQLASIHPSAFGTVIKAASKEAVGLIYYHRASSKKKSKTKIQTEEVVHSADLYMHPVLLLIMSAVYSRVPASAFRVSLIKSLEGGTVAAASEDGLLASALLNHIEVWAPATGILLEQTKALAPGLDPRSRLAGIRVVRAFLELTSIAACASMPSGGWDGIFASLQWWEDKYSASAVPAVPGSSAVSTEISCELLRCYALLLHHKREPMSSDTKGDRLVRLVEKTLECGPLPALPVVAGDLSERHVEDLGDGDDDDEDDPSEAITDTGDVRGVIGAQAFGAASAALRALLNVQHSMFDVYAVKSVAGSLPERGPTAALVVGDTGVAQDIPRRMAATCLAAIVDFVGDLAERQRGSRNAPANDTDELPVPVARLLCLCLIHQLSADARMRQLGVDLSAVLAQLRGIGLTAGSGRPIVTHTSRTTFEHAALKYSAAVAAAAAEAAMTFSITEESPSERDDGAFEGEQQGAPFVALLQDLLAECVGVSRLLPIEGMRALLHVLQPWVEKIATVASSWRRRTSLTTRNPHGSGCFIPVESPSATRSSKKISAWRKAVRSMLGSVFELCVCMCSQGQADGVEGVLQDIWLALLGYSVPPTEERDELNVISQPLIPRDGGGDYEPASENEAPEPGCMRSQVTASIDAPPSQWRQFQFDANELAFVGELVAFLLERALKPSDPVQKELAMALLVALARSGRGHQVVRCISQQLPCYSSFSRGAFSAQQVLGQWRSITVKGSTAALVHPELAGVRKRYKCVLTVLARIALEDGKKLIPYFPTILHNTLLACDDNAEGEMQIDAVDIVCNILFSTIIEPSEVAALRRVNSSRTFSTTTDVISPRAQVSISEPTDVDPLPTSGPSVMSDPLPVGSPSEETCLPSTSPHRRHAPINMVSDSCLLKARNEALSFILTYCPWRLPPFLGDVDNDQSGVSSSMLRTRSGLACQPGNTFLRRRSTLVKSPFGDTIIHVTLGTATVSQSSINSDPEAILRKPSRFRFEDAVKARDCTPSQARVPQRDNNNPGKVSSKQSDDEKGDTVMEIDVLAVKDLVRVLTFVFPPLREKWCKVARDWALYSVDEREAVDSLRLFGQLAGPLLDEGPSSGEIVAPQDVVDVAAACFLFALSGSSERYMLIAEVNRLIAELVLSTHLQGSALLKTVGVLCAALCTPQKDHFLHGLHVVHHVLAQTLTAGDNVHRGVLLHLGRVLSGKNKATADADTLLTDRDPYEESELLDDSMLLHRLKRGLLVRATASPTIRLIENLASAFADSLNPDNQLAVVAMLYHAAEVQFRGTVRASQRALTFCESCGYAFSEFAAVFSSVSKKISHVSQEAARTSSVIAVPSPQRRKQDSQSPSAHGRFSLGARTLPLGGGGNHAHTYSSPSYAHTLSDVGTIRGWHSLHGSIPAVATLPPPPCAKQAPDGGLFYDLESTSSADGDEETTFCREFSDAFTLTFGSAESTAFTLEIILLFLIEGMVEWRAPLLNIMRSLLRHYTNLSDEEYTRLADVVIGCYVSPVGESSECDMSVLGARESLPCDGRIRSSFEHSQWDHCASPTMAQAQTPPTHGGGGLSDSVFEKGAKLRLWAAETRAAAKRLLLTLSRHGRSISGKPLTFDFTHASEATQNRQERSSVSTFPGTTLQTGPEDKQAAIHILRTFVLAMNDSEETEF